MNFLSGIRNGLKEILAHKFRSFLSMIGIILGVAALVAMVGVVRGMVTQFRTFFEESGGALKIRVQSEEPPLEQQHIAFLSPGRTLKDWEAVRDGVPLARLVVPQMDVRWKRVNSEYDRTWMRIRGTVPEVQELNRLKVVEGRFLSDLDVDNAEQVIVLSDRFRKRLFPDNVDPIGKRISVHGKPFTVVGVLEPNPTVWWKKRLALIPISTAHKRFTGSDEIHDLDIQAYSMEQLPDLIAQLENTLLSTHNGIKDFRIETREEELAEFKQMEAGFTYSLGGVAAISLLVGGIGIMNVMLAVINERIREIGVRKAVGARGIDIFVQFLAEAVVISVMGGLIGAILSVGLVELLKQVVPSDRAAVVLAPDAMVFGFLFSVGIGLLSGIYPALRAARLNVIEALRYE